MTFPISLKQCRHISALLLFTAALSVQAKTFTEQFAVDAGDTLRLRTDVGALHIRTHDQSYVEMEVTVRGEREDRFELEHEQNDDTLTIIGKMDRQGGWSWGNSLKVEFELVVPKEFDLELHTSGGSIDIEDLLGDVDARTSGGSVNVGNITGRVDLHTSGGSIKTEAIVGPLDAHTSGGSIRATFAAQLTEDAELNTSGGSITAYLKSDVAVDLDASTSGGRVKTDFDVNGRIKKQSIRGEINGGGPRLKLHTSGGSVSVRSL